ncbi:GPI mannosyltransferase 1 [Anthonomus grandis grandis]|uniref:GPI mannosyltransferase 1 n=1 Tax=Anthonomus grandis grandis TaxID=2921223 RepID=UPI00216594D5|nr:GPI mannosyltransferase 1 [Anthonomus grandis grandis]
MLARFLKLDILTHVAIAFTVRVFLILYGAYHDAHFEVPYTDIDYKVFTDAARHVTNYESPFKRYTYRYSPIIALLLTPNILVHPLFGKFLFCFFDLIVAGLIYKLVQYNISDWFHRCKNTQDSNFKAVKPQRKKKGKTKNHKESTNISKNNVSSKWALWATLLWLYNPMTIAISTRGNSDSLSCFLVIFTLFAIQKQWHPFIIGLIHGLSIHFRIYPIIYSFLYYIHYSNHSYYFENDVEHTVPKSSRKRGKKENQIVKKDSLELKFQRVRLYRFLLPNLSQTMLVLGTFTSLVGCTTIFYYLYGYKFLYESLIYHFIRKDYRHNFSLYFYLQYLMAFVKLNTWYTSNLWQPILINLPPIILILNFSVCYGLNKFSLNFGVLVQTIVFVIFNKVMTSQYFVWIMGILPLCIWQISLSTISVVVMITIWIVAQVAWLLPAYLLEFKGEDTFFHTWVQCVSLFCAHVGILGRLIKSFIIPKGVMDRTDEILALEPMSTKF